MLNYNKNNLINECLDKYYETFSHTLDTADFVPDKFNDKILWYIFKNLKKSFKALDKDDRIYQRKFKKQQRETAKQEKKCLKADIKQAKRKAKLKKKKSIKGGK